MSRKDFSRKSNSYASVLMADNRYSNFRFANKRSSNDNSPLRLSRYATPANGDRGHSAG